VVRSIVRYLFSIEPLGSVERLYERGRVADEQRVTYRSREHADHRQPYVRDGLRGVATVAY